MGTHPQRTEQDRRQYAIRNGTQPKRWRRSSPPRALRRPWCRRVSHTQDGQSRLSDPPHQYRHADHWAPRSTPHPSPPASSMASTSGCTVSPVRVEGASRVDGAGSATATMRTLSLPGKPSSASCPHSSGADQSKPECRHRLTPQLLARQRRTWASASNLAQAIWG